MRLSEPPRRIEPEIALAIRKDRKILHLTGWMLVLMGLGLGVFFWFLTAPAWTKTLDATGEKAEGTIVEMVEYKNVHYGSVHPWEIVYRFETASGEPRRGKTRTVIIEFVRAHRLGDTVTVSYDPDNPAFNKIYGVEVAGVGSWVFFIPAAEIGIGLILLGVRGVKNSIAQGVYEQGTETRGRVVSAKLLRSVHMGWKHPVSVRYAFEDDMGQECFGKIWSWHPKAREIAQGQVCTVLYDRVNPSHSILYDALAFYLE